MSPIKRQTWSLKLKTKEKTQNTERCSSHEWRVGLLLVDLVPDVVDVGGEVVLGVIVDDVTDIRAHQALIHAVLQVFQEPEGQMPKVKGQTHR